MTEPYKGRRKLSLQIMASKKRIRSAWDEAINQSAGAGSRETKKRTSGRHSNISKAMRVVDEETRKEVRDARLDALEADNYVENAEEGVDEAYIDSEGEDRPQAKRDTKRKRNANKAGAGSSRLISNFKIKSLAQWVFEAGYDASNGPNYVSIAAGPSSLPQRHFCSVCGYWGYYSCTRCGMRFCSNKCSEMHKETRCLKFAA